ncbi:MAG: ImmA/IrrE family metallo-endopeptidase [Pyrinomonadaceae bacterium]
MQRVGKRVSSERRIPPTRKGRDHEIRARALREFAGLTSDNQRLDPFKLAHHARLMVIDFKQVQGVLSVETVTELLDNAKDSWSGGAASKVLPGGEKLIVLNPTHGRNRQRATLMEEICHVFLGHTASRLAIRKKDRNGNILARDYHADIEEEAYATGAAALVPFGGLREMIEEGKTAPEIAGHYGVSKPLVEYRLKVSRLWDEYTRKIFQVGS